MSEQVDKIKLMKDELRAAIRESRAECSHTETLDTDTLRRIYESIQTADGAHPAVYRVHAIGELMSRIDTEDGPFKDLGALIRDEMCDVMNRLGDLPLSHFRKLREHLEAQGIELPDDPTE